MSAFMKGNLNGAVEPKERPGKPLACNEGMATSRGQCPTESEEVRLNDSRTGDSAPAATFGTTHWSVVLAAGQEESLAASEALSQLYRTYWYPLYVFVRRQGCSPHDAEDVTQGFFLHLLKRRDLATVRRERGRFRSFLLVSLKHFLVNEWKRLRALRRGGGQAPLPFDVLEAETRYAAESATEPDVERGFDRRWAAAVLAQVFKRLREEYTSSGRQRLFDALKACLSPEGPGRSQEELAAELGLNENACKQAVHRLRARYRELLRMEVAQTVAAPGDIEDELRHLVEVLRE
jgi:RNA polymerase sigma factor (sigma-70 family)